MSQLIGDRLPAPLRFEFGTPPMAGAPPSAVLLATVDADGSPRVAVLSKEEVGAPDAATLRLRLHASSASAANAAARPKAALWCVLDAAAYTIKGTIRPAGGAADEDWAWLEFVVEAVWRDFDERAPMIAGPTYRAAEAADPR